MKEVATIALENEMDLILAHRRSMKLAELCGLSLSAQTTFATAVSEVARCAIANGSNSRLSLGIQPLRGGRKNIYVRIVDKNDLTIAGAQAFSYAKKLLGEIHLQALPDGFEAILIHQIAMPGIISDARIQSFIDYFKFEAPLSPYDELRKKNIQLLELSEKLSESEYKYRQLTDTLPLLIFSVNQKGEITFANRLLRDYLPKSFTSFTSASLQHALHTEDSGDIIRKWEQARLAGSGFSGQIRLKYGEEYIWHLMTVVPQRNEQGDVTNWTGFFVDINAQMLVSETLKHNEELRKVQQELILNQKLLEKKNRELERQSEFVDTIVNSSVDAVILLDSHLNILMMNPAASSLYAAEESLIGANVSALYPYTNAESIAANLSQALEGHYVHDRNYWCDVHQKSFEIFYIPVKDNKGRVYRVLMTGHDITFTVNAEIRLKEYNEELSVKNRELEQFAYIASHDLQEPLRKIRNFTSLAERNLSAEQKKSLYFDKINASAAKMSNLIRDVLNYSRLAMQDNEFEDVDLNVVLADVLNDFEFVINEKNARIERDTLPVVKGIPVQLNQLFYNIISNSLKFCKTEPELQIRYESPGLSATGNKASFHTLYFTDNGIGIEEQYAGKIFAIFQRLHTPSEYEGTGIGLALCKRIVDNHMGTINVESAPGEGTTFRIMLPAQLPGALL